MNDYIRGAFQALTWVREVVITDVKDNEKAKKVLFEIDEAINDIEHGVAIDFRWRLRSK